MKKIILLSTMLITVLSTQAQWAVEGVNDTKGQYTNEKTPETWTIYYSDSQDEFVALYADAEFVQGNEIIINKVEKISEGIFKIIMKEINGNMEPTWILKYNSEKKYYDLHTSWYDAKQGKWFKAVFAGSSDNG